MKKLIVIILLLLLLIPGYFGYQKVRRNNLLSSGEPVLMTNESEGLYTVTDYVDLQADAELIKNFKVIDKLSNLSDEEFAEHTNGLTLFGTVQVIDVADVIIDLPEGEALVSWNDVLNRLSQDVRTLCSQIPHADQGQQCIARHAIFLFAQTGASQAECELLFPARMIDECKQILESGELGSITDQDNNGLLDIYEFYANPTSFDSNPTS